MEAEGTLPVAAAAAAAGGASPGQGGSDGAARPPEPQLQQVPGSARPRSFLALSAMAQALGAGECHFLEETHSPGEGHPQAGGACPEHALDLAWFCCTERRLVCAQCPVQGGCREHRVRPLAEEAAERRNKIVDDCEKLQLQSAAIAKFATEVLPEKKKRVVAVASSAREVLIQRLNLVRSVCESEEQRLLDVAHSEEERAHQNILTQQVHWNESLQKLDTLRTYMVAMITSTDDGSLVQAEEEIFERTDEVHVDEKTVSPLLRLSEDKKTLTFSPKKASRPDPGGPARFDHWPNALAEESFCSGVHAWRVRVAQSGAYKLGISYGSLERKGAGPESRLGCNASSWVFSRYGTEFQFSHNGRHQAVEMLKCPAEIGVLVDLDAGEVLFFDPDSCTILHVHHEAFAGPIYPALAVADQSLSLM